MAYHPRQRFGRNEFNFAAWCVRTAINDQTDLQNRNWISRFNVPRPEIRVPLFTDDIRRALLRLMAVDMAISTHVIFQSWFVGKRVTRRLAKSLIDLQTVYYLNRSFSGENFLKQCALMAELSALCFLVGARENPDYTIGCLLYIIRECIVRQTMNWSAVYSAAEQFNKGAEDPTVYSGNLTIIRRSLLEGYTLE